MVSSAVSVVDQVSAAMSTSTLQHQVNVTNIANRDAQGYQRLRLRFDQAMEAGGEAPSIVTDRTNTPVSLEQDLVTMSTNLMHYQTLARALGRYFAIAASIAAPNRG